MSSVRKRSNKLTTLKVDDATLTDDLDIAETMNSYLSTVYTTEDRANFPEYVNIVDLKLSNIYCNTNEVCRVHRNSNPNKSPGRDTLSPHVMKECAAEIADLPWLLLNRLFTFGQVSLPWKITSMIVPIYKKGKKSCIENYRQVSLTCIACKVGEKIVKTELFISGNRLIYLTQSNLGFPEGRSALTQLISCFNDWVESRNR